MNDYTYGLIRSQLQSTRDITLSGKNQLRLEGISDAGTTLIAKLRYDGIVRPRIKPLEEELQITPDETIALYQGPLRHIGKGVKYANGVLGKVHLTQTETSSFFESHFEDTFNTGKFNYGLTHASFTIRGEQTELHLVANSIKRKVIYEIRQNGEISDNGQMNTWDFFTQK